MPIDEFIINRLKNARGDIETVIDRLFGRFNMQKLRARDLWHLSHRFMRKILAYNFCFVINTQLGNPHFSLSCLFQVDSGVIEGNSLFKERFKIL